MILLSHGGGLQQRAKLHLEHTASPGLMGGSDPCPSSMPLGQGLHAPCTSPAPPVRPFSLSSNQGVMQEAGEQKMQALGAQYAPPCTQQPWNPAANSLPGRDDTFQQDDLSPAGLQAKPNGIWGKPSTLPGTLGINATRAGAGGCNSLPLAACSLSPPCSCCPPAAPQSHSVQGTKSSSLSRSPMPPKCE